MSAIQLSPEQREQLNSFANYARSLDRTEAQEQLLSLYRQDMINDNIQRRKLRQEWGIENG